MGLYVRNTSQQNLQLNPSSGIQKNCWKNFEKLLIKSGWGKHTCKKTQFYNVYEAFSLRLISFACKNLLTHNFCSNLSIRVIMFNNLSSHQ